MFNLFQTWIAFLDNVNRTYLMCLNVTVNQLLIVFFSIWNILSPCKSRSNACEGVSDYCFVILCKKEICVWMWIVDATSKWSISSHDCISEGPGEKNGTVKYYDILETCKDDDHHDGFSLNVLSWLCLMFNCL